MIDVYEKTNVVFLLIVLLLTFASCSRDFYDVKQAEYHEGFEEIEQVVLAEYSDYIVFSEPIVNEEENTIIFEIGFLRTYIRSRLAKQNPYELIESVREIINQYIYTNNGTSFFSECKISIVFYKPNDYKWSTDDYYSRPIAALYNYRPYNYDVSGNNAFYEYLDCVEFYYYNGWVNYFRDGEFLSGVSDIKELYMINDYSANDVINVINNIQNLEYAVVGTNNIDELRKLRPDIAVN